METKTPFSDNTEKTEMTAKPEKKKKNKKGNDMDAGLTAEEKKLREEQRKRAARKKRKKIIKALIIVLIILAILGGVLWRFLLIKKGKQAQSNLVTYTVERRTITEKLSATGTLKPADSYTVTAKVRGDILECFFEEGDEVKKDDILYVIEQGDADTTVRSRRISLENAQENLDDLIEKRSELTLSSDLSGTVTKLYVEEGDTISKGATIADIVDKSTMLVDIPFHALHADSASVGDAVNVTIEGSGEIIPGRVKEIANVSGTNAYGAPTKTITISVSNPGGISKNTRATAELSEDMAGTDVGTFYYNVEEKLTSEYGGKIVTLSLKEGGSVREGQKIIGFDSKDLEKQIKNARENLETAQINYDDTIEGLDDYNIRAPITGTVVEKGYNVGESIDVTGGNQTVAIIYDLSSLTFDMSIDELDIFSIEKGQEVAVTSDALSGETYYGSITKISKVGSTTSGTTTYPVTVTITDPNALERLLPGMNIDAEIVINRVENVLAVPTGAIARGNTVKVIKNSDSLGSKEAEKGAYGNMGGAYGGSYGGTRHEGMTMPEGGFGAARPERGENAQDGTQKPAIDTPAVDVPRDGAPEKDAPVDKAPASDVPATEAPTEEAPVQSTSPSQGGSMGGMMANMQKPVVYGSAPADTEFETVRVQVGISDDSFVEIISGLEEGDIVIVDKNQSSTVTSFPMGMGGMPMGGGMGMGGNRNMGSGMGGSRNMGGNMGGNMGVRR